MSRRRQNPEEEDVSPADVDLLGENVEGEGEGDPSLEDDGFEPVEEEEDPLLDCMEDLLEEVKGLREDIRGALGE